MKSDLKRLRKEKTFHEKSQKAFRGTWRIRTAVNGFADRCLATRPRNHSLQMVDHYIIASLSRIASAK